MTVFLMPCYTVLMLKRFTRYTSNKQTGFTIVELLIVVVVIAILAAITIVSYNGIQSQALESSLKADLKNATSQLGVDKVLTDTFPTSLATANSGKGIQSSPDTLLQYTYQSANGSYCLVASSMKITSKVFSTTSSDPAIKAGSCSAMRVWVARGATQTGCSPATCYHLALNTQNFSPAGTYTVRCTKDGASWSSASYSLPANGSTQLSCYTAPDADSPIGVEIVGWGQVETVNW